MPIQNRIQQDVDRAIEARIKREAKGLSKSEAEKQKQNKEYTARRRRFEDQILARELGINIEDL